MLNKQEDENPIKEINTGNKIVESFYNFEENDEYAIEKYVEHKNSKEEKEKRAKKDFELWYNLFIIFLVIPNIIFVVIPVLINIFK